MKKKSIIKNISRNFILLFCLLSLFVIFILTFSFYKNYKTNLTFLEKKAINEHKNVIYKINENLVSNYLKGYNIWLEYKKNNIKNRTFLAYSLLQNIYYSYKDNHSIEYIKNLSLNLLKLIKFDNGKCYYTVFDSNGKILYDPYINDNLIFSNVIKKIINNTKKGKSNFYIVPWRISELSDETKSKIIFGIYSPIYDWIIITGFYLEDFNKDFNNRFLKRIKDTKLPENVGLLILNSDNSIIYSTNIICKNLIQQLKKIKMKEKFQTFFTIKCGDTYHTVYAERIISNNWKVFTSFVNKKVLSSIYNAKKDLLKNFIFQISSVLLFSFLIFIVFFINFGKFRRKLISQFAILNDFIKKVPTSYEKIDLDKLEFVEIEEIAKYSNKMIDTIKKLNSKLIKEKNFLNAILENMPYGIGVLTPDFNIEYANDYALTLVKYDKTVIGKNFFKVIPKNIAISKDNFILIRLIDDLKKNKKVIKIDKFKLFKKDGTFFYVYLVLVPLLREDNQDIERILIIFYDITEELKLKREIEKLTKAVEHAPVSIVITGTDFRIEYINPFCEKLTGYSLNEIIGKTPKIFGTKYNKKFYKDIIKAITSGKIWEGEFLNKKKNGELYWEHVFISPIFNDKGKIINFVSVKEDITERKKVMEELKKAKEKAEIANMAKSQFLANMSHEIRTPMNAIIGFINLLLETELNETQKKYLHLINESSKNLLRILNDILDISKLESTKMEFENRGVDFKKFIKNCANIFSGKAAEKNLNFYIEIDENIPDVLIFDEVRISQVINNLLNNAIKFTEKGYVKLEAKLLSKDEKFASILFCVKDTGIGIPKNKLNSIFDTFSQVDGSITRRFGGTGLGLSIAKKIVEYYDGKIWVESEEGKGSEFYFSLKFPIGDKKDLEPEYKDSNEESLTDFSNVRILVVEDNITNQILIKEILKKYKINVTIANNGKEALEILSENEFDLIFMDWHMPEMDGVEALEILRKAEKGEPLDNNRISKDVYKKLQHRKYIVIALTAAAMKSEKEELTKKGFDEYISKPLKIDELLNVLKKYLKIKDDKTSKIKSDKLDFTYLKNLVDNDEELLNTIIDSFKNTYLECIEKIEKFLANKDYKSINITAHTLKGTAANIGFNNIAETCKELENASKSENVEKIELLLSELKDKFEKFFK